MKMTCDTANKLIKQLTAERNKVLMQESEVKIYSFLQGEEPYKPEYDFGETQARLNELAVKVVTLKHAINVFNTTTVIPGTELTVDAALVRMAILSSEKDKLNRMRQMLPKTRSVSIGAKASEYHVRNFDGDEAEAAYQKVSEELMTIQQGLNNVNLTIEIDVDIEL